MKKIIIILFLAALPAVTVFSESNPHDSLLFDGENSMRTETYYSKTSAECEYRVTYVKGNATGKIRKMQIFDACGQIDTIYVYENGAIEKYSVIKGGEHVKTGPESSVKIELSDGSYMFLGPNTDYTLPSNICETLKQSYLDAGGVYIKIKKLIGGGEFQVSDRMMIVGVRGTEFSVEIVEVNGIEYSIIKVYESAVEVSLKDIDTKGFENKNEELTRLIEQYQAGKITLEEFSAKSLELTKAIQNVTSNLKLTQIVEAGYMLKTDGKVLGDPVQFNASEDTWFKINE